MRLNRRNWWSLLAVMFALLIAVPGDAFAQRRGGSRSRSRPTAKRTTPKSKPRAAAKPARGSKTGKASNKGWGSSTKKAGTSKKATKADKKAYEKAKANGTTFKDRKSAAADYKKKNAVKYGSTYTSKPATRPGHIPPTTKVGGSQTTIIYNQSHGGYGYMNAMGTWMMYDAMADVAMAGYYNRQMASAGYYYGAPPRYGMGGGMIALIVIGGIVFVVVVGSVINRKGGVGGSA